MVVVVPDRAVLDGCGSVRRWFVQSGSTGLDYGELEFKLDTTTTQPAHQDGRWIQTETLRVFLAGYDGHLFGSGWHQDNHHPH